MGNDSCRKGKNIIQLVIFSIDLLFSMFVRNFFAVTKLKLAKF